jgi:protein gp37
MRKTKIQWTRTVWNPITGCTKVSAGCKFCYAVPMSKRLQAIGLKKYMYGFNVVKTHPNTLSEPYKWKKSTLIFVNSMSDLFHPDVPEKFIQDVFKVMNDNPHHVFQVLTKRSARLLDLDQQGQLSWSENIWMGVSIEDDRYLHRIDELRRTGADIKFLSCEPLIGPLPNLDLNGIDWVIVGGESGYTPRPMAPEWATDIRDQCLQEDIPFFFKQWGGKNKKKTGRILEGRTWDEYPPLPTKFVP